MAALIKKIFIILLATGACAHAAGLAGFADGLSTANAGGWACAINGSANVSVAAYAGQILLGIYPMTVNRPDVARYCRGGQPHGFEIAFDASTQALFVGQAQLSLYAVADGFQPMLLRSSNPATSNPLPLPAGQLLGLTASRQIAVTASATGGAPRISLSAGGPTNDSLATESGVAQTMAGGIYGLQLPLAGLNSPVANAALLPVFGSLTSTQGATVALASPLALPLSGDVTTASAKLPINVTFAQSGSYTGIRNNLFTQWLPANTGFAGLTGEVSLTGNDESFDEALVELGTVPLSKSACLAQNATSVTSWPPISRLWASILKSNTVGSVNVPVNFALPFPVAGQPAGSCLMTLISAGYPYLSGKGPQYATTQIAAQADVSPVTATTPNVNPFGMGGEFSFTGAAAPTSVYVGIMANVPIAVDGIAATASAAPVTSPIAASVWLPAPQGNWAIQTNFMYMPAAVCAGAKLTAVGSNSTYSVLRIGTPAAIGIPSGAVAVMGLPMFSSGTQAIQRSAYAAFPQGLDQTDFRGNLKVGDCLVAYSTAEIELNAVVDFENQSTVFLRPLPTGPMIKSAER